MGITRFDDLVSLLDRDEVSVVTAQSVNVMYHERAGQPFSHSQGQTALRTLKGINTPTDTLIHEASNDLPAMSHSGSFDSSKLTTHGKALLIGRHPCVCHDLFHF